MCFSTLDLDKGTVQNLWGEIIPCLETAWGTAALDEVPPQKSPLPQVFVRLCPWTRHC